MSKGPTKVRQKKLFYVFGKGGLHDNSMVDKGIIMDSGEVKPQGKGYQWPSVFKQHGHVYFDMIFLKQGKTFETLSSSCMEKNL